MKKRLICTVLCLMMLISACAVCFTGCSTQQEEGEETEANTAATLVMWCVTKDGTKTEEAARVAEAMSDMTKSKYKAKLIVKYFSEDEYYDALEAALAAQEQAKKEAEERAALLKEQEKAYKKMTPEEKAAYDEAKRIEEEEARRLEEERKKWEEEQHYDENGNLIIDKTQYPEVEDYQVDILYLSGYDKYQSYIKKEWLSSLNAQLTGDSKRISNYVSTALLNAVQYNGTTYAIPNNNVIGEYTYMLIDKELYDKYYYSGNVKDVHSVVDLASFLEDIDAYEPDVLPINGDVDYCMSLIASYWDIDSKTLKVTGDFSVLGYAYKSTDKINRGDVAIKFDSLLTDETYQQALKNLMNFKFNGYFGEAKEGQRSAVSFIKGDAMLAKQYEDDKYVVVVDYPRATNEDIYGNMFAVSAFTSNLTKSMQVITLLNTDPTFRNLFQYGLQDEHYTRNADGTVTVRRNCGYYMDVTKTGNEFITYVPEGTDTTIWDYAKQQNRESMVAPLLGFDFNLELKNEADDAEEEGASATEYAVEKLDTELINYIAKLSDDVWARIQRCKTSEELDALLLKLEDELDPKKDDKIKTAMVYESIEPEFDPDGELKPSSDKVDKTNVKVTVRVGTRTVIKKEKNEAGEMVEVEVEETYLIKYKTFNPYQIYYRWMNTYKYLPANFGK